MGNKQIKSVVRESDVMGRDMLRVRIADGAKTTGGVPVKKPHKFNVFDLKSYEEVERLGLAQHFDRQSWEERKKVGKAA